ncbi:hypothetical protein [Nonomuraea dietziae]|uniref:hypothetical protein n=1 Tax=Nonomuraea dietziae TaxID=65515 RepID=UPI0033F87717
MTINQDRVWGSGGVGDTTGDLETKARKRNAFDPDQPRDRKGRWIETGATVSIWGGGSGTVSRNLGGGRLEVHTADGRKLAVHRNYLTVTQGAGGKKPSGNPSDRPRPLRAAKPSAGVEDFTPQAQDTRVPVADLQPGQLALVYGFDSLGADTYSIGRVTQVAPAGSAEDRADQPGRGWNVFFAYEDRTINVFTSDDAVARVIPAQEFDALVEAERARDEEAATRIALDIYKRVRANDDAEAEQGPLAAADDDAIEQRVREAIQRLEREPGGWVSFTNLRRELADLSRDQQDAALHALNRRPDVTMVPEDNQKALLPEDRDAALQVGDQPKHYVRLDTADERQRMEAAAAAGKAAELQAWTGGEVREPHVRWAARQLGLPNAVEVQAVEGNASDPGMVERLAGEHHQRSTSRGKEYLDDGAMAALALIDAAPLQSESSGPRLAALLAAVGRGYDERGARPDADFLAGRDLARDLMSDGRPEQISDRHAEGAAAYLAHYQRAVTGSRPGRAQARAAERVAVAQRLLEELAPAARDERGQSEPAEPDTPPQEPAAAGVQVPPVDARVRLANGAEGSVAKTRPDGALIVQLDSGARVNAHASAVRVIDEPADQEQAELRTGQWITTLAFNDPVRVEQVQDTLTGAEVEVVTIRGDRRTLPETELGDWQPADEPANHRADGAPVEPQARPQEGLFADMGTDKHGNRDLFADADDDPGGETESASQPGVEQADTPKQDVQALSRRAREAFDAGHHERALSLLDEAERLAPGNSRLASIRSAVQEAQQAAASDQVVPEGVGGAPADTARAAAPEGQAYADEIQVGDTVAEAQWQSPGGNGALRMGEAVYANPAGPARLSDPKRDSRRVTDIQPAMSGQGVTFVFDDGTRLTRRNDELITRGEPAEVVGGDGARVGEWTSHKTVETGDRVRYPATAQILPSVLDKEALGIPRYQPLTVEGRLVRRQPGMPSFVMADATVTLPDGQVVELPGELRFTVPDRVIRLDNSQPVPAPREVEPAALLPGDRIAGPTGDVVVESVEPLDGTGIMSAQVRDDADGRQRHLIDPDARVALAPDRETASVDEVEARSLARGDWAVIDDAAVQVVSDPEVGGGRVRFDASDDQGRVSEMEMDARVLVGLITGTPAPAAVAVDAPGAPPPRVNAAPLPEGTPAGRVRLRTDQRRRLLDLELDANEGDVPPAVRQAAARLRARQELSAAQMQALAGQLRAMTADESLPAARRRSLGRTADWIDAAHARLEGFPPPPHHSGRSRPEPTFARNLLMGDTIALPDQDGSVRFGTITAVRSIKGFGLRAVHVRHEDGSVEQRILPDGVDLWLMPDLPADQPEPPAFVREHVTADRVNVGDTVRWGGDQFRDPVLGQVVAIERRGGAYAEARRYEVVVLDADDERRTITVTDRGWPSLERLDRGPASTGQPYDSVMPDEDPAYVGWRDLRVGDRASVSMVTGTITGITRHPAADDTPEGVTVSILADSGETRSVSVFDDPDRPEDVVDLSVMRLIAADDNAAARIGQVRRERERITREREFTAFLAEVESSRSRWAATDVANAVRGLPDDTGRETAVAAALEQLDRIDALDDTAAATLAFRLGAREDTQAAAMQPATRAITDAVKARATGRIRQALDEADLLPGETWPRALARVAASYRDHPPAPGVLPAGVSLARLRDRLTDRIEQQEPPRPQAMPEGADLTGRLAAYRAALPDDLADFGQQPITRMVFEPTTLDQLEAGHVPAVRPATLWAPDVADDDGPGPEAMRQLAVLRAAGADVDARYQQHLAGRDAALAAELEAVVRERGRAWRDADTLDAEITRERQAGGAPDQEAMKRRDELAAAWKAAAVREAELRRLLAETRRSALAATLAEIRPAGGEGLDYTDRSGKPLTGRAGSNAAALRYVEEVLPSDWLRQAREAGPIEVVTGPGQHQHVRADGTTRISLPADDDTADAPVIRDGQPGRTAVPSSQPAGVPKATVAAHELAHHLEATVPGLRAAGHALLWDRTSYGEVGDRVRDEPMAGEDRGRAFEIYPGNFPDVRTGRVNADGSQEVFANVLESLAGNGDYLDDDLRQWGLGVLALLGTDRTGPQGGLPASEVEQRDPLDGVNLLALTDDQLRALIARLDDPQALDRLRGELQRREQRDDDVDLSSLSDAELESMLLAGWDGYGEDPARTALQDRVIAEAEAREAERGRRGDELGDLAASDLLSMETDDLASLFARNLGRYDTDPAVTALLDQISAELEDRDRRSHAQADPYAGLDLSGMSDEQLAELLDRHQPRYDSDPHSAALVRRIFAEIDSRDRDQGGADERSEEERRIDELVAQGWTPRDATAEVYGLDPEEMERQERVAMIDAQRGKGERREQVVRRLYQQWVYEQWLEAEKATNGYLLSPIGRRAGADPKRLWGGNPVHANAYASEELKRWWAEQPNGGRMTYDEWRAQWLGSVREQRAARERRITSGNGRDFG